MSIATSIRSVFAARAETEEASKKKQDAIDAKTRDSIRSLIAAEFNGATVTAKDAESVAEFCGTAECYEESVQSCTTLASFNELGQQITALNLFVDATTAQVADLTAKLTEANEKAAAAKAAATDQWVAGVRDIKVHIASADAKATHSRVAAELQFYSILLDEKKNKRQQLTDQQASLDCSTDPTSKLKQPFNFSLHTGPRERPQNAKQAAANVAQETADRRRRELRESREREIVEINASIARIDKEVRKADLECDDAAERHGSKSVQCNIAVANLQAIKSKRKFARDRFAELQSQMYPR